jgi:hypothetical protein
MRLRSSARKLKATEIIWEEIPVAGPAPSPVATAADQVPFGPASETVAADVQGETTASDDPVVSTESPEGTPVSPIIKAAE